MCPVLSDARQIHNPRASNDFERIYIRIYAHESMYVALLYGWKTLTAERKKA